MVLNICSLDERYYLEIGTNNYDIFLLGQLLSHLRRENQNREFIMHELRTNKFIQWDK